MEPERLAQGACAILYIVSPSPERSFTVSYLFATLLPTASPLPQLLFVSPSSFDYRSFRFDEIIKKKKKTSKSTFLTKLSTLGNLSFNSSFQFSTEFSNVTIYLFVLFFFTYFSMIYFQIYKTYLYFNIYFHTYFQNIFLNSGDFW